MEYKALNENELFEFLGGRRGKISVKVDNELLTVNSYQPPTGNIYGFGEWAKDNLGTLKTCRYPMTSFRLKAAYKEATGNYCGRTDVKLVMQMLGFNKKCKGTEDYYYNCKLL